MVGTLLGAVLSLLLWLIAGGNNYVQILAIAIASSPLFHLQQNAGQYAAFAPQALLTLDVVLLGKFNDATQDLYQLALDRTVSVLIGVFVAVIFGRYAWPLLARRELRKTVSYVLHNIGVLYSKIAIEFLVPEAESKKYTEDFDQLMSYIQLSLVVMEDFNNAACFEPSLRRRHPYNEYASVIQSLNAILNRLIVIRQLSKGIRDEIQNDILRQLDKPRAEAMKAVILTFRILEGSFHSKVPVPAFLPNIVKAHERLTKAFLSIDRVLHSLGKQDLFNSFAYSVGMQQLVNQIQSVVKEGKQILGEESYVHATFRARKSQQQKDKESKQVQRNSTATQVHEDINETRINLEEQTTAA